MADLDAVVQNSEAYDLPRLHRIDSCRALLDRSEISDRERFFLMEEMRTLYDKYRTDSATVYASKALSIFQTFVHDFNELLTPGAKVTPATPVLQSTPTARALV